MCGICGAVHTTGSPVSEELIHSMNNQLSHRGPDDGNVYLYNSRESAGLGHKRLSIIDISEDGRQPMSNEDHTIWMVFNGEIYNFQSIREELKARGHRFRSNTDGEVILHLYEEKGIDCVHAFNGMFAFAIWDQNVSSLYICRDRVGIKPLVYFQNGGSFAFASELRSLLKHPGINPALDTDALDLYLTLSYVPAPYTIFQGIKKLLPGHYLHYQKGQTKIIQYWDAISMPERKVQVPKSIDEARNQLRILLTDSVKKRLIADVPLGAFLSGGIDSSIVVALMAAQASSSPRTFSIGYSDMPMFNETHYAKLVADRYGTNHTEILLNGKDILDVFTEILDWFDEPFSDSSAIPMYIVSRETRKHVTVALSGDGGDELFAGYRMYRGEELYSKYSQIPRFLRKGLIEPFLSICPDARYNPLLEQVRRLKKFVLGAHDRFENRFLSWNQIFNPDLRDRILKSHILHRDLALQILTNKLFTYDSDSLNRMLYTDLTFSLPNDMLTKVDWMSMKTALEVRVPLLDHRIVEYVMSFPGTWKRHHGTAKYVFIESCRELLPPEILSRPKWGFEVPVSNWLKNDLHFLIDEYLTEIKISTQNIFNYKVIRKLIDDHMAGRKDTGWQLWNLIVFQSWYQRYLNS